jgi:hypothetical protein
VKVAELIEALKRLPKDAPVFLSGGQAVTGAELVDGRVSDGYFGQQFRRHPTGKVEAVMFTHLTELSTGEVSNTTY